MFCHALYYIPFRYTALGYVNLFAIYSLTRGLSRGYSEAMAKTPPKNEISQDQVLAVLAKIEIDGTPRNLIDEGIVSGVVVKNGHVGFSLEVKGEIEDSQSIKQATEAAIRALPGVLSATAMLTAHRQRSSPQQTTQQTRPQQARVLHQPAKYMIAIASGKGGVGKSTTAVNLALAFAKLGLQVAMLDADIYGPSLPKLLGINKKPVAEGGKIIPLYAQGMRVMSIGFLLGEGEATIWRGPMVMSALEQMLRDVAWDRVPNVRAGDKSNKPDILVIDMPPGTGDAQLTLAQRTRLDGAVIVSTPQDLALIDARKGLAMFSKVRVPVLGIIENMSYFVCPQCGSQHNIFSRGGAEAEAKRLGVAFLGAIPLEMSIRESSDAGTPLVASHPDSASSKAYIAAAEAVLAGLKTPKPVAPTITIQ